MTSHARNVDRVVWVCGVLPEDTEFLALLSQRITRFLVVSSSKVPAYRSALAENETRFRHKALRSSGFFRGNQIWLLLWGLRKVLNDERPDTLHVVAEPWSLYALQAARYARRHRECRFVLHGCDRIWSHGVWLERAIRRRVTAWSLGRADGFLAESLAAIERAKENGLPGSSFTAVAHTNPRSETSLRPPSSQQEVDSDRRSLGLPAEGRGVGFLGRLVQEKGVGVFLDAIDLLVADERLKDAWFAIAGDGPMTPEVRERCHRLGVRFLGRLAYPTQAHAFTRSLTVLVVPSYTTSAGDEQSPRVVIEAMLAQTLVVVSDCGAMPEMVGENGFVARERDATSLAAAICLALNGRHDEMRVAARGRAIERYSAVAMARTVEAAWA